MRVPVMLISAVALGALTAGPVAAATAAQQKQLDRLSPQVRAQVEARLGPGQTVKEVVETMMLNDLSREYAEADYFIFDHEAQTVTVIHMSGKREVLAYDPATMVIVRE